MLYNAGRRPSLLAFKPRAEKELDRRRSAAEGDRRKQGRRSATFPSSSSCSLLLTLKQRRRLQAAPPLERTVIMARSISHAARLTAALSDSAGLFLSRRSYSAAAGTPGTARRTEEKAVSAAKPKKMGGAEASSSAASSWVPDPVTGYYRPANRAVELDAAELRQRLLSR